MRAERSSGLACAQAPPATLPVSQPLGVGELTSLLCTAVRATPPPNSPPASFLPSANASLLHSFWCQPASQLPRDQLSALIRAMATRRVLLRAWQVNGCGGWAQAGVLRAGVSPAQDTGQRGARGPGWGRAHGGGEKGGALGPCGRHRQRHHRLRGVASVDPDATGGLALQRLGFPSPE